MDKAAFAEWPPYHTIGRVDSVKFAASITATGILGFLLLEALKILFAPAAAWLLAMAMLAAKFALLGLVVAAVVVAGVFVVRRANRNRDDFA